MSLAELSSGFPLHTACTRRWPFHQWLPSTSLLAWPISLMCTEVLQLFQGGGSGEGLQLRTSRRENATIIDHIIFFFPEGKRSQGPLLLEGVQPSKVALLYLQLCELSCSEQLSPIAAVNDFTGFLLGLCSSPSLCFSSQGSRTCCCMA